MLHGPGPAKGNLRRNEGGEAKIREEGGERAAARGRRKRETYLTFSTGLKKTDIGMKEKKALFLSDKDDRTTGVPEAPGKGHRRELAATGEGETGL